MAADCGSTMRRYSKPSAYPRLIEVFGEHRLDLIAIVQRAAGVGHDSFADVEALQNFNTGVGRQPDPDIARLDRISLDYLHGQMVDGGARDGDAATALGVDAGAGEHADLHRRIAGQRYSDTTELIGAIDLGGNQPDGADQIGRVVAGDAYRGSRSELQHVDGGDLGVQLDLIVDGNAKHRSGLRRGRRADDGFDLGDQACGRRAE